MSAHVPNLERIFTNLKKGSSDVSCGITQMVEMLRKLLLTGVLVVIYKGSPPQVCLPICELMKYCFANIWGSSAKVLGSFADVQSCCVDM